MSEIAFGHYIRMIVAASRVGNRLVPLRDVRLLEDDEDTLRVRLAKVRREGIASLTVEDSARWGALMLYSFGRESTTGHLDGELFGSLCADDHRVLKFGHELWVRVGVAGSERELVALTTQFPAPNASAGRRAVGPPARLAVGRETSIDRLLRSVIDVSPSWRKGMSLRRLVVTPTDEMEFERALGTWFRRDVDDSPVTMGAAFILYGSRIFARESRYEYGTLEKRLGVQTLVERVAMRFRAIEKGATAYFGIDLSGGPEQYIEQMLVHSGGGWEYVAEALEKLEGAVSIDVHLSWNDVSDALLLLPKRTPVTAALRAMLREPPTRDFLNMAIRLVSVVCRNRDRSERTPEWLGEILDIASEDARRRIAALVGARKRTTIAPSTALLDLQLRNASGEMPRVVVALPHSVDWPDFLPPAAERFRLFVRGESHSRPVVYSREGLHGRRQGASEHLELPIDATLPLEVMLEGEDGSQVIYERLTLPDAITVFSLDTGRVVGRLPPSGELAIVTQPGCQLVAEWGRELPSRSGLIVRLGELTEEGLSLIVRRADGTEERFELKPRLALPVLTLEGFLDGMTFARFGRVAVTRPRVHGIKCGAGPTRVFVEGPGRRTDFDVTEGEGVPMPGIDAPGLYRVHLHAQGRPRQFIHAPHSSFTVSCDGSEVVVQARWGPQEPARIQIGEHRATGSLTLALRHAESFTVLVDAPSFARDIEAIRWNVTVHPRRVDVVAKPGGDGLENPIFERIRFGGGLRIYGNPREDVVVEAGFYRRRIVSLDARGEGFFPFAHLDDNELDHDLGRGQMLVQLAWQTPHHREERRIAREESLRTNIRTFALNDGESALDVEVPPGISEPIIEALPLWKPWEGWTRLSLLAESPPDADGVVVGAPSTPGPYLCGVSDATDTERRLRAPLCNVFVGETDGSKPDDELERLLWQRDGDREDRVAILAAFERRLERDGDDLIDGLLRLFERSGTRMFTIGLVFVHAVGWRRLLARANHACGRATTLELRLLALCDQERVPWSAIRRKDVTGFLEAISSWDDGAYTLAVQAACSARAGIGFWLHEALPDCHARCLDAHVARLASCWMGTTALNLQQRDAVLSEAETPPEDVTVGARVATLYDARRRLAAGTIRVEKLRAFARETVSEARMDAELMDLDGALRGLAMRVTAERTTATLSRDAFVGAQYAERVVPRLYEFWLEAMAAKHHRSDERQR